MKCKLCGCNLDKEDQDDELDLHISTAHKEGLCSNCWFKTSIKRFFGEQVEKKWLCRGK
jgi:hypothetical protein